MTRTIRVIFAGAIAFTFFGSADALAITWEHDLTKAFEKARIERKVVMADFYTDWCHWCKKLDTDVYGNAAVNRAAEKFVCVKVNCEIDKNAVAKYSLRGYPTIIFFNASGNVVETIGGYRDAATFAGIMQKILDRPREKGTSPRPAVTPPPAPEPRRMPGEFILSGIMLPKAIINGQVVKTGDVVEGGRVIKITAKGVTLSVRGEELFLKIP